jgi:N-acetylmuramoyl-L-alanine amidase
VVFGPEAPLAVADTKLLSLTNPVRGDGTNVYAEPEFFQKVLSSILEASVSWEANERRLVVKKTDIPEVSVEASVADFEGTTKVVLRFSQLPPYKSEQTEEQVLLRFAGFKLLANPVERLLQDKRVSRLLIRGSDTAIFFREKGLSANVYALANPPRLVIDVSRPASTSLPLAVGTPPPLSLAPVPTPLPVTAKTIVLDAGHGGTENGAKGPGGLLEKDATLTLTKAVRDSLVKKGYKVILTRESDATVALDERASIANAAKADLFLSIHANASRSPSAHGTEVFYLSLDASDRAAAAVAEAENTQQEPAPTPDAQTNAALRDLDLILWDLAQNQHLGASARLAEIIQADFNRLLGVATRGVKQAPFRVLIGVNAPAVLVEVAFITNPEEEKKLGSEEFRKEVAETIVGSLETYYRVADGAPPVPALTSSPAPFRGN